ncbi:MAG: hypothetical protein Q7S47_02315 [bacterium]|nr:hypothetical protein [bacterium]
MVRLHISGTCFTGIQSRIASRGFFWGLAPLIGSAAAFSNGVRWAALPVFMVGFGPMVVFISSFVIKNSKWRLTIFDYACGVCCVLALILWWATKNPTWALVLSIIGDAFAGLPTLIKSFKYPETETGMAYVCGMLNVLTSFFAFKTWGFFELAFPLYILCLNSLLLAAIYRKRIMQRIHSHISTERTTRL